MACQGCGTIAGKLDLFEQGPIGVFGVELCKDDLAESVDDGEQIIEIVRNSTGQLTQGFHLLGLSVLFFQRLAFAAVFRLAQLALDCRDESAQIVFENVIARAGAHQLDGFFFADFSRDDQEWHVQFRPLEDLQGRWAAEMRHRVIRYDNIPLLGVQRAQGQIQVILVVVDQQYRFQRHSHPLLNQPRVKKKVAPKPTAASAHTLPPCRWTIRFTEARPMPLPGNSASA